MSILFFIIVIILLTCGIVGYRIYTLTKITTGQKIDNTLPNKEVLIVLDVQNDTLNNKDYSNNTSPIKNINNSINYAKDNNIEVLYVKQVVSNPIDKILFKGKYIKNSNGVNLSKDLNVVTSLIYDKVANDAFSNKELEEYLYKNKITTIYIVGADALACVYKTALGAINRNYNVTIIEDSIFSSNNDLVNKAINKYHKKGIASTKLDSIL